jgi:uncharacterized protein (TIGR03492 family)
MGVLLGRALRERGLLVAAYPLVGEGRAYVGADLGLVGVQATMPSGGFILEGSGALWRDIKAGLLRLTWRQIRALRQLRGQFCWAVGVGDVYPLLMNTLFLQCPLVFLPTAKSDYIRPHYGWEVALMRKHCRVVFPRDARTAAGLAAQGVAAEYHGNLMMDALDITDRGFGTGDRPVIGLLPGSREPEAYRNTALLLASLEPVMSGSGLASDDRPACLLALAGGLSLTELAKASCQRGWRWVVGQSTEKEQGIAGYLMQNEGPGQVAVVRGRFGDVLAASTVVLGMSGTGNEQAAGLGVPVVAPIGSGPQFTRRFALDQRRLLGEAVWVVEGVTEAAQAVRTLLKNEKRRLAMGRVGQERMGLPGGTARMAERIMTLISRDGVGGEM